MTSLRSTTWISVFVVMLMASPLMAQQKPPATPSPAAASQTSPAPAASAPAASAPASVAPAPAAPVAEDVATDTKTKTLTITTHELSAWSMFLTADIIVKGVMIFLAFASLTTWTIFFAKMREQFVARRRLGADLDAISESRTLSEARLALGAKKTILAAFIAAAVREVRLSSGLPSDTGIKERAASSFAEITRGESNRMRVGMGILATVGSTAPFIGLFGTVWGIMNSFIGISKSQTTNLAVVAPGIAEALLATACGLVAAIPAVIIYNHFTRDTKRYIELVNQAAGATGRLLSRDLDRSHSNAVSYAAE